MRKPKKIRVLMKQAKMGKPHAMYLLGIAYQIGSFCTPDMVAAAAWISSAAELGHSAAIEWMKDYFFDDNCDVQSLS